MGKIKKINGCDYELVKALKSQTVVRAWHVKVDGEDYQINIAPIPRYTTVTGGYAAQSNGTAVNLTKPLFEFKGDDFDQGLEVLTNLI